MPSSKHLKGMNKQQRKAVRFGLGKKKLPRPLLIIAGAGTGKTKVLARRVVEAILGGAKPAQMLLLTFTRRAASEMLNRVGAICGPSGTKRAQFPWAGTFHSVAAKLLRQFGSALGIRPGFQILDRGDAEDLIDIVRHDLGFSKESSRFPHKAACLAIYSRMTNCCQSLRQVLRNHYPSFRRREKKLAKLFASYDAAKQHQGVLDYDDLLQGWHLLLQDKKVSEEIRRLFRYVFVDEYQDTNRLQAKIIERLKPNGRGVTAVGDDAQAIYSFRGATVENILLFANQFKLRAKVIKLERNYRSTQPILTASNAVMALSREGYAKNLYSTRKSSLKPTLVSVNDAVGQARYVAMQILRARDAGVPLREQAVLIRASSHSAHLELELARRNIPFAKYGGMKFLEASHIKDVLSIIRWCDNPRNRVAAVRTLKLLPGIGSAIADRISLGLVGGDFRRRLPKMAVPKASAREWPVFSRLLNRVHGNTEWPGELALVLKWYLPQIDRLYANEDPESRKLDLQQLVQIAGTYRSRQAFLTELTLDPPDGSLGNARAKNTDEDHLIISTIHSAKGQEYSHVYILNAVEGCIPSSNAGDQTEKIEEERRVLHVAMTRAKNQLEILAPRQYFSGAKPWSGDRTCWTRQTRFIPESTWVHFKRRTWPVAKPASTSHRK
jgi:DNA helicase II / ATP-dependent DNA helicase PcrA